MAAVAHAAGEGRCIFRMRIEDDEAEKIEQRKTGVPARCAVWMILLPPIT